MKALNRAIARTVSQIARHAGEGCHVPMIMALENHLDSLLTMERKQLEQAGMKVANTGAGAVDVFASNLSALQQQLAEKATPPQPHANDNAQAVTSAPEQPSYQVGDILECIGKSDDFFTVGKLYPVVHINDGQQVPVFVIDDKGNQHALSSSLNDFISRGQPAPDVIDMNDPRNWQAGDILLRDAPTFGAEFQQRCEYVVSSVHDGHNIVYIYKDDGRTHGYRLDLLRRDQPFKWLRHGEAQQ